MYPNMNACTGIIKTTWGVVVAVVCWYQLPFNPTHGWQFSLDLKYSVTRPFNATILLTVHQYIQTDNSHKRESFLNDKSRLEVHQIQQVKQVNYGQCRSAPPISTNNIGIVPIFSLYHTSRLVTTRWNTNLTVLMRTVFECVSSIWSVCWHVVTTKINSAQKLRITHSVYVTCTAVCFIASAALCRSRAAVVPGIKPFVKALSPIFLWFLLSFSANYPEKHGYSTNFAPSSLMISATMRHFGSVLEKVWTKGDNLVVTSASIWWT